MHICSILADEIPKKLTDSGINKMHQLVVITMVKALIEVSPNSLVERGAEEREANGFEI